MRHWVATQENAYLLPVATGQPSVLWEKQGLLAHERMGRLHYKCKAQCASESTNSGVCYSMPSHVVFIKATGSFKPDLLRNYSVPLNSVHSCSLTFTLTNLVILPLDFDPKWTECSTASTVHFENLVDIRHLSLQLWNDSFCTRVMRWDEMRWAEMDKRGRGAVCISQSVLLATPPRLWL